MEHEESGRAPLKGFYSQASHANDSHSTNGYAAHRHAAVSGRRQEVSPLEVHPAIVGMTSIGNDSQIGSVEDSLQGEPPRQKTAAKSQQLQQLGEARRRQGLSVRCVAQRLGKSVGEVRAQEEEDADLPLSELYRWQSVLDVPIEELLSDPQDALSPKVLLRARMLRVMKTAQALRAQARSEAEHRLSKLLISQLVEIMPELKEVAAWPTVGHRRTADEMGRIAERTIPDDFMHEAS